ncbi:hypothetical protein CHUAL_010291 [Chamberlinius hualienensis]
MAEIAKGVLQKFGSNRGGSVSIEDPIFKLHSSFTAQTLMILALFTFIKTLTTPMVCYGIEDRIIDKSSLSAYCELQDKYGIPNFQRQNLASSNNTNDTLTEDEIYINHSYFHTLPLIMMIQSILFYIPHYIWKKTENGNIANLTFCFHYPIAEYKDEVLDQEIQNKRIDLIVTYLVRTWGKHRNKAFLYWVCVALNFIITIIQIGLIDFAFSSEFSSNGIQVYNNVMWTDFQQRSDRISMLFPRLISCDFTQILSNGNVEIHRSFCALPYNYTNERLLLLIISWFLILAIIGFVAFMWCALIFCIPCCQSRWLGNSKHFVTPNLIEVIMDKFEPSNIGDCFILWLLSKNMNSIHYERVLTRLSSYKGTSTITESDRPLIRYNRNEQTPINAHETYDNL